MIHAIDIITMQDVDEIMRTFMNTISEPDIQFIEKVPPYQPEVTNQITPEISEPSGSSTPTGSQFASSDSDANDFPNNVWNFENLDCLDEIQTEIQKFTIVGDLEVSNNIYCKDSIFVDCYLFQQNSYPSIRC